VQRSAELVAVYRYDLIHVQIKHLFRLIPFLLLDLLQFFSIHFHGNCNLVLKLDSSEGCFPADFHFNLLDVFSFFFPTLMTARAYAICIILLLCEWAPMSIQTMVGSMFLVFFLIGC
jgi:hypothetical protein